MIGLKTGRISEFPIVRELRLSIFAEIMYAIPERHLQFVRLIAAAQQPVIAAIKSAMGPKLPLRVPWTVELPADTAAIRFAMGPKLPLRVLWTVELPAAIAAIIYVMALNRHLPAP